MINNIEEYFTYLNNIAELEKNPAILLLTLPKESHLKLGNLPKLDNANQIYVLATTVVSNGNLQIKRGTQFDVIFPSKDIRRYIECRIILKYVNVNPSYEIDYLPGGYTGICLLEFENGIPTDMISKLAKYDEKRNVLIHDNLILVQKVILDELLDSRIKAV